MSMGHQHSWWDTQPPTGTREQLFRGFGASASNKSEPGRHESNSSNRLSGLEQEFCSSSQALLHVISKMDSFKAPRVFIT